jgi:hypothetical protein
VAGGLLEEEGSLYKHSFEWMVREAHDNGLLVDENALDVLLAEKAGPPRKVESLRSWWHLAELIPRLHLQNQYPPAWRRRPTVGFWRGRKLPDGHRSGGLTVHASVPERNTLANRFADSMRQPMNEVFRQHVEQLHPKFEALMAMTPITLATLPKNAEKSVCLNTAGLCLASTTA